MLAPEAPPGPVSTGEHRAELPHLGRAPGRICPVARICWRARAERGDVEEDWEHAQVTAGQRCDVAVVERELVAAWGALDTSPVEGLAEQADAHRSHPVEVLAPVGAGLAEGVLGHQPEKGPVG